MIFKILKKKMEVTDFVMIVLQVKNKILFFF